MGTFNADTFAADTFGIGGEVISDHTAMIQELLDKTAVNGGTLTLRRGTYRITDNLYWHGNVSIDGSRGATLLLDAVPTNRAYWICGGTKGHGANPSNGLLDTLTGEMRNLTIAVRRDYPHSLRMINGMRFRDLSIRNVTFEIGPASNVGALGFYNHANYCLGYIRKGLTVCGCKVRGEQGSRGSEGIGIGESQDVLISDNTVMGMGDDAIAFHNCRNVVVANNICNVINGRILADYSQGWSITGNNVTRTSNVSGGFYIGCNCGRGRAAPSDGVIANNVIQHGDLSSPTYGIRCMGLRRGVVANNIIRDTSGFGYGIWIEGVQNLKNQDGTPWTDPEGIDPPGTAFGQNVIVSGNVMSGERCNVKVVTAGCKDSIFVTNNIEEA